METPISTVPIKMQNMNMIEYHTSQISNTAILVNKSLTWTVITKSQISEYCRLKWKCDICKRTDYIQKDCYTRRKQLISQDISMVFNKLVIQFRSG